MHLYSTQEIDRHDRGEYSQCRSLRETQVRRLKERCRQHIPNSEDCRIAVMNSRDVRTLVVDQIADRWGETNLHGVDLRSALVMPSQTTMIVRSVRNGKIKSSTVDVWIVLREVPDGDGYIIFYDDDRDEFGLASKGFPDDRHPVICGYFGEFWNAFKGM